MHRSLMLAMLCWFLFYCKSQHENTHKNEIIPTKIIGGGCDGCELMYIDMPRHINQTDISSGWYTNIGHKLHVTGTVFKDDGKTPAPDVILYYWHTNDKGLYESKEEGGARNHGDLRGWVKTDVSGRYSICSSRPAPYPNDFLPAHVHISVKEPDMPNEYYCDDIVFDDDTLLLPCLNRYPAANRCGSGIVRISLQNDVQMAVHDLVLGLNIPNYPHMK
ncbi:MAG: intradiol ring-cleavage dioxygenase [Saprospiraceae bacterium]|nr:intradiol ring-cleavage dioxygenase [Saprospiraceae bacterium]